MQHTQLQTPVLHLLKQLPLPLTVPVPKIYEGWGFFHFCKKHNTQNFGQD